MSDRRLIEEWLPIAEIGIEATRERTPMTPFPAPNRLHVWWARRPLVASRAAVLGSVLPWDANRKKFLRVLGIHGDPVAARIRIDAAKKRGVRLGANPYGYRRAFSYSPTMADRDWMAERCVSVGDMAKICVLDPMAGGGSIPLETIRVGATSVVNDLNPVAVLLSVATADWPSGRHGDVQEEFFELGREFIRRAEPRFSGVFPTEPDGVQVVGYLWAHTVRCPYCNGVVPLSPNWRLAPGGKGVRLRPRLGDGPSSAGRVCEFEVVESVAEQSAGTVSRGLGDCPYPDCGRVIGGDEIKQQARDGEMGHQLYAIAYKKRVPRILKSGRRGKDKWVRGYRAPCALDDNGADVAKLLDEKLPGWVALDIVPSEKCRTGTRRLNRSGTGCRTGAICSRLVNSSAMALAWRCSARCLTPTARRAS